MLRASNYQSLRDGDWRLVVLPDAWSEELQSKVLALVSEQAPSKHPLTLALDWPAPENKNQYYLKVFHPITASGAVKDLFRSSKALRFWRQGLALSAAGFNVPQTVAAGELRSFRFVQQGFILTAKVDGDRCHRPGTPRGNARSTRFHEAQPRRISPVRRRRKRFHAGAAYSDHVWQRGRCRSS